MSNIFKPSEQNKYLIYIIVSIIALCGFLLGFDTGVISGAILFIKDEFHLTTSSNSLVVSVVLLGACISALMSGYCADYCGRRRMLLISAILYFLGALVCFVAPTVLWLISGRIVVGFAVGISSYVAPLYISELAPFRHRGAMVGFHQLFITIGIMVSYFAGYILAGAESWRQMFALGMIPAMFLLISMLFAPESPRWLLSKNKEQMAYQVLRTLHSPDDVALEMMEIKKSVSEWRDNWRVLLKPWLLPAMIVGFGVAIFQQLVGINIIIYYAPTLFEQAGFGKATSAMLATAGIGTINVIFTIIALPLIDKWGRRPLLLFGLIGMTISWVVLAAMFGLEAAQTTVLRWMALAGMMIYVPCFAMSFGPIGWLMISEVFPLRIRGIAASLATAAIWAVDMLVILTFLPLEQFIGTTNVFLIFAVLCVLGFIFVYCMVPETKDITLEHIETNLRLGKRSRHLGN